MIPFYLYIAMASQMMCDGSPHRRECVAWAKQCLIQETTVDSNEARDMSWETCVERMPSELWEEKQ